MELIEKDLEDMIYDACKSKEGMQFLNERGLPISGKVYRQVNIGNYGIADLITVTYSHRYWNEVFLENTIRARHFFIDIYELKRDKVGIAALLQVCRYRVGLEYLFLRRFKNIQTTFEVRLHLIGSGVETGTDFLYLTEQVQALHLHTYRFQFDGLHFESVSTSGWSQNDDGKPQELTITRHFLRELVGHLLEDEEDENYPFPDQTPDDSKS
jgi:hypothetical protein